MRKPSRKFLNRLREPFRRDEPVPDTETVAAFRRKNQSATICLDPNDPKNR